MIIVGSYWGGGGGCAYKNPRTKVSTRWISREHGQRLLAVPGSDLLLCVHGLGLRVHRYVGRGLEESLQGEWRVGGLGSRVRCTAVGCAETGGVSRSAYFLYSPGAPRFAGPARHALMESFSSCQESPRKEYIFVQPLI